MCLITNIPRLIIRTILFSKQECSGYITSRPGNKTADWKQKIKNCRNFGKPPLYTHMLGFARVSGNVFTVLPICGLVAGS